MATKEDLANQSIGSESGLKGHPGEGADWPALQANYTYLMSCDLIESCRSLNGEMSWDTGDLGHLRQANQTVMTTTTTTANSPSVAVGCQTDAEIVTIPGKKFFKILPLIQFISFLTLFTDLQRQLQVLREWLKRMESKVPKLILRPKWTRATLERRIVEYKVGMLISYSATLLSFLGPSPKERERARGTHTQKNAFLSRRNDKSRKREGPALRLDYKIDLAGVGSSRNVFASSSLSFPNLGH